jgi:hypothetical protein
MAMREVETVEQVNYPVFPEQALVIRAVAAAWLQAASPYMEVAAQAVAVQED